MKQAFFTGLAIGVLVLSAAALARDTPLRLAQTSAPASDEASIHGYGDSDKTCQEWTDGCRTCRRPENGEAFCSNIGMSCQPVAISCARRVEEKVEEKK